ncbi:hypothetical protein A3781_07340 [Bacillus badius]|nr:hypothetical protein A3781_07340 [Bacillus badius]
MKQRIERCKGAAANSLDNYFNQFLLTPFVFDAFIEIYWAVFIQQKCISEIIDYIRQTIELWGDHNEKFF